jgi:beta-galactosidase
VRYDPAERLSRRAHPDRRGTAARAALAIALAVLIPFAPGCREPEAPATPYAPPASPRTKTLLSGPWRFLAAGEPAGPEAPGFDDTAWSSVTLPHTWGERPHRSAWYRVRFPASPAPGQRTYLVFEGAATYADVYVNGRHLGQHRGAYTRFLFDATPHVVPGENVLAVRVNNDPAQTADSLPSGRGKRLYLAYGGLYRKAWVLTTGPLHVDPTDHASSGVFVTPGRVDADAAEWTVKTLVRNASDRPRRLEVAQRLAGADGATVWSAQQEEAVPAGSRAEVLTSGRLARPRLWSPADPHLYTLWTEVRADGQVVDVVQERTGFRDFRLQGRGFLLNGAPIALRGVGKHQESEVHLSALTDEEIREDFAHLKDLGVNAVRLAHYPHAQLEYDLADELGLLVWAENGHSNAWKSDETGDTITREMVRQNYNHPSIVMWSVGNETGFVRVNRYAAVAQAEDPVRLVTYASNTGVKGKKRYPELDFIAQNTYRGWYRGDPWEFEEMGAAMGFISENGAGAVVTNHTDYAAARKVIDQFEPEEYRQLMAEVQYQVVFRDRADAIPLYLVWILRDFGIDKYKDVWNTKGLLTYSNFKKDAYYLYRAFLRPDAPVVHVTSKTYFLRQGDPANGIKVYSNRPALNLTLNGVAQGTRRNGEFHHRNGRRIDNVFFWGSRLAPGRNEVVVTDDAGHRDTAVLHYAPPGQPPPPPGPEAPLQDLRSSNPRNPAHLIGQEVREQWPYYYELDGTADNTFDRLPAELAGARWIATRRLSRPENRTDLSFTARRALDVWLVGTDQRGLAAAARAAGLQETPLQGRWRDNDLALVPWRAFTRRAAAGERVRVPGFTGDYVVLVREPPAP